MARGEDTGNHPRRKVSREMYQTSTVEQAANEAQRNALPTDSDLHQKMKRPGITPKWVTDELGDW